MLEKEERPEIRENLVQMKKDLRGGHVQSAENLPRGLPVDCIFNCAARIYTRDGAGFQLLMCFLYPYYERDIKSGILDDETAKFLIANLFLIDPHYYQISGVDENDRDMTNHLSYLILEAADSINISCNLTVRMHENCDREFMKKERVLSSEK